MAAYVGGNLPSILTPADLYTEIMDMEPSKALALLENVTKGQESGEGFYAQQQAQQQQAMEAQQAMQPQPEGGGGEGEGGNGEGEGAQQQEEVGGDEGPEAEGVGPDDKKRRVEV